VCLALCFAGAATYGEQTLHSTTSHEARQQAIRAIPLDRIDSRYRQRVRQVLHDSSLYRRLPTEVVDCDPDLFTFLAQNPETLVEVWKQLGITKVSLERINDTTCQLGDGAGTTGELVIVEQECSEQAQNRIVLYSEGAYEGKPFQRPITAQCVLLLRSGSVRETNDRTFVAARLDTFIRIERTSIELFAKAIHPLVGKTADRNFSDTMTFVSNFSQAAELRPDRIERLVMNLPRVTPDRLERFVQLAYRCGPSGASITNEPTMMEIVTDALEEERIARAKE